MPLDTSLVRALCFDVDGTLSDTDDHYVSRLSSWLRRVRFVSAPEVIARRLVMWLESPATFLMGLADRLTIDDELSAAMNWLFRHSSRPVRPLPCVPGVQTLIAALHGRFPMAVVSARDERTTLAFLEQAGLRSYFDVVVTALSAPRTKPYPDPVVLAASQLGVAPGQCLMIGDTTVDIRSGRAAGAQTVGVLCGFGERNELERHGAHLILPSTSDLAGVL